MKSKKLLLGGVIGVLVVLFAVAVFWRSQDREDSLANLVRTTPEKTSTAEVVATTTEANTSTSTPSGNQTTSSRKEQPLTYDQAMKIYGQGYRIQFSKCHGNPGRLAIKKGAKFMLDNRDGVWHNFEVGKQKFKVSGWGFVIVTATEVGDIYITCDGGGAAVLDVQA